MKVMHGYREVFKPDPGEPRDPGRIFYTITSDDVGKSSITTTAGEIHLRDIIGRILPGDAGRRLYRVPGNSGGYWFWQCESNTQRDKRLGRRT